MLIRISINFLIAVLSHATIFSFCKNKSENGRFKNFFDRSHRIVHSFGLTGLQSQLSSPNSELGSLNIACVVVGVSKVEQTEAMSGRIQARRESRGRAECRALCVRGCAAARGSPRATSTLCRASSPGNGKFNL